MKEVQKGRFGPLKWVALGGAPDRKQHKCHNVIGVVKVMWQLDLTVFLHSVDWNLTTSARLKVIHRAANILKEEVQKKIT